MGAAGGGEKKTTVALYFIVLKGYSSQWSHCQAPCLYIHGGNQTHAKLIYGHGRGEMAHHEVRRRQTGGDWRHMDLSCPMLHNTCPIS